VCQISYSLSQLLQQRFRLLEVSGIEALGEPAVDQCLAVRGRLRTGPGAVLTQTRHRLQLSRLGLLVAGDVKSLPQTLLCSPLHLR
jgi:hypothetical protein